MMPVSSDFPSFGHTFPIIFRLASRLPSSRWTHPQDFPEQVSRHRHFRKLERDVPAMADYLGHRVEAGPGASRKDDPFSVTRLVLGVRTHGSGTSLLIRVRQGAPYL